MGSLLTDQSHTYIICLLLNQPPVIPGWKYSTAALSLWEGVFNKTLAKAPRTRPIELLLQNINQAKTQVRLMWSTEHTRCDQAVIQTASRELKEEINECDFSYNFSQFTCVGCWGFYTEISFGDTSLQCLYTIQTKMCIPLNTRWTFTE